MGKRQFKYLRSKVCFEQVIEKMCVFKCMYLKQCSHQPDIFITFSWGVDTLPVPYVAFAEVLETE